MGARTVEAYPYFAPEEYLEREERATERSEYLAGLIVAMAGATVAHNKICINLSGLLWSALRGTACFATSADLRVAIETEDAFFYPDLVVHCNQELANGSVMTRSPNVVIEVLSESTRSDDLKTKLKIYQRVESLHTIVYVDSTRKQVLLYERDGGENWPLHASNETDALYLKHLSITLPIDDIYERVF